MEQQVTINELVVKFIDEMRRIGYAEEGIYREHYRIIRRFARYYELSNTLYYSIETTTEYLNLMKERENRGEIGSGMLKKIRIMAQKMNEYFITGHLSLRRTKRGTVYRVSAENERLIDCFISWKKYGTNTCDDVRWVVRKYLYYLEQLGHVTLESVTIDEVRIFILDTAMGVKASSLHNILLSATTGMRAVDIIHLKLTDIDWRKGEIRIIQKKTKHEAIMPLVKTASDALGDYILNGRPDSEYTEIFLRISPPYYAIQELQVLEICLDGIRKRRESPVRLLMEKVFMACRTRNVAHARISFCRTLGEYQKAIACGLRPHECRVLKRIDVDLNSGELRIINTKWNQSRTIIMSDEVCELVRKYAIQRDIKFPESEYLFPAGDGGAYSATQIQNRFRKFYELSRPDVPKELLPAVRVYDLRYPNHYKIQPFSID